MAASVLLLISLMSHFAAASLDITTFTMVASHFQLCFLFLSFPFSYPAAVTSLSGGLASGFALEISPSCLTRLDGDSSYVLWWTVKALVPLALMAPFAAAYLVAVRRQEATWAADRAKPPEARLLSVGDYRARSALQDAKKRSMKTVIMILVFALMYGVSAAVGVWHCVKHVDGTWRLLGDPSLKCSWTIQPIFSGKCFNIWYFVAFDLTKCCLILH